MPAWPSCTPEALIFDFDGTLVDNSAAWEAAWLALCHEAGCRAPDAALRHTLRADGDAALLAQHLPGLAPAAALARRDRLYCERFAAMVRPRPGAAALLRAARTRGLRCAIASASRHETLWAVLGPGGLAAHFDCVLTREDVAAPKPDPEVYLGTLARLGLAAGQALAFEDSPPGLAAARAAGLQVWAVGPLAQEAGLPHLTDFRAVAAWLQRRP